MHIERREGNLVGVDRDRRRRVAGAALGQKPYLVEIIHRGDAAEGRRDHHVGNEVRQNDEAGLKTMRFMANELQSIVPPGNLAWDYNEMLTGFHTTQTAQTLMWPGGFVSLSDPAKSGVAGRYGTIPPPGGSLRGGNSIGINEAIAPIFIDRGAPISPCPARRSHRADGPRVSRPGRCR